MDNHHPPLNEIESAHAALDRLAVPRQIGGSEASLASRIQYLAGQRESAKRFGAYVEEIVHRVPGSRARAQQKEHING